MSIKFCSNSLLQQSLNYYKLTQFNYCHITRSTSVFFSFKYFEIFYEFSDYSKKVLNPWITTPLSPTKKEVLGNSGSLAFSTPHSNKNISHVIIAKFQFVSYIISRKIYTCSQKFSLEGRSFRETIRLVERKILCFGKSKRGAFAQFGHLPKEPPPQRCETNRFKDWNAVRIGAKWCRHNTNLK